MNRSFNKENIWWCVVSLDGRKVTDRLSQIAVEIIFLTTNYSEVAKGGCGQKEIRVRIHMFLFNCQMPTVQFFQITCEKFID